MSIGRHPSRMADDWENDPSRYCPHYPTLMLRRCCIECARGLDAAVAAEAIKDLTDQRLEDVARYELHHLHTSDRLPLNPRVALAMVQELKRRRAEERQQQTFIAKRSVRAGEVVTTADVEPSPCTDPRHAFSVEIVAPLHGPKKVRISVGGVLVHACSHEPVGVSDGWALLVLREVASAIEHSETANELGEAILALAEKVRAATGVPVNPG